MFCSSCFSRNIKACGGRSALGDAHWGQMSGRNWSLEDLVEFEARLEDSERSGAAEKRRYRELVEEVPK